MCTSIPREIYENSFQTIYTLGEECGVFDPIFVWVLWATRALKSWLPMGIGSYVSRILKRQSHVHMCVCVWMGTGRGFYWLEFALTICSAWSGHKFTAHLICDFVSLSLSRQLAMATNWNNFIQSGITHLIRNTHTHTNAHFACIYLLICVPKLLHPDPVLHRPHFAFIYGINYEASLPWFIFRLYLYLPTQLSTMYHTYIISSSILMSFANSSCFCFELSPLAKHYKLSELISSPNASWITLIIYKNCWAILYEIRGK